MYVPYDDIENMDGPDFVYLCADILRRNGFKDLQATPAGGETGVDLIAHKDGVSYGIRCLRERGRVGVEAVREALAGSAYHGLDKALVLTDSGFTSNAHDIARNTGVTLWSRRKFTELYNAAFPEGAVDIAAAMKRSGRKAKDPPQKDKAPSRQVQTSSPQPKAAYTETTRTAARQTQERSGPGFFIYVLIGAVLVGAVWLLAARTAGPAAETFSPAEQTAPVENDKGGSAETSPDTASPSSSAAPDSESGTSAEPVPSSAPVPEAGPVEEKLLDYVRYTSDGGDWTVSGVDASGKIAYYLTVVGEIGGRKVTALADSAFSGCDKLRNVHLPASLTDIGESAFRGCRALQTIKLPDSMTAIGDHAFEGCTSLTEITIPKNVTMLGRDTFQGSGVKKLRIPEGCEIPSGSDPFGLGDKCRIDFYKP